MEKKKPRKDLPRRRPTTSARRHRLGQHFLRDERIISRILEEFGPGPHDRVLEVGPGPGALTRHLAGALATLVAVELDAQLADDLCTRFADDPAVTIVQGDILALDWDQLLGSGRWRLLGNLPYSIATPLLVRSLQRGDLFSDLTVMVQREVAWRMLAEPGSGDYGPLAVLVSLLCPDARLVLQAPPGAFSPPPQVHSAVVALTLAPAPPGPETTAGIALARRAFLRRRKKLINALGSPPAPVVSTALEKMDLAGDARPEQVKPADYVRLARLLNAMETT